MDASENKRPRKSNWGSRDEILLVEEVQKRESLLFGKLTGPGRTVSDKTKAWQEIANLLNSGNPSAQRSIPEMKKKYQNIKQKAKEKRSEFLRPKTGGGRRPPSPSPSEQLILDQFEGRPSMCGLPGGIDTAASASTSQSSAVAGGGTSSVLDSTSSSSAIAGTSTSQKSTLDSTSTTSSSAVAGTSTFASPVLDSTSTSTYSASLSHSSTIPSSVAFEPSTSSSSLVSSDMLLREELINIRENRKLIKEKQVLVELQKHHYMLKIKQRDPFFDLENFMSNSN